MTVKKTLLILAVIIVFLIASIIIWFNLPFEVLRYKDIKIGNELVVKIEDYAKTNGLPESNDYDVFKQLGFEDRQISYYPIYTKLSDNSYELCFCAGFDGPYLIWNSNESAWKMGMPTIVTSYKQKDNN